MWNVDHRTFNFWTILSDEWYACIFRILLTCKVHFAHSCTQMIEYLVEKYATWNTIIEWYIKCAVKKEKWVKQYPQKIWVSKCKILKQKKMMIRKSVYESGHQCTNSVGQSDGSCSCYTPNIINFFMVWNWGMTQALAKISSLSPFGALNTSHGLLLVNDTMQDILSFRTVPNQPINRSLLCHSTA